MKTIASAYRCVVGVLLIFLFTESSFAHEVRPAYLELRQITETSFDAMWKVPAKGDLRLSLYVIMPPDCEIKGDPRATMTGGAYIERWSFVHHNGLVGDTIFIEGLKNTLTDVLVRIERLDGSTQVDRIEPARPYLEVVAAPGNFEVAWTYLVLGVEHILFGIDHLLFVLALLLIVEGTRKLIATITAFTLAHSVTLAAAALGFVHVPGPPVEAIIALSIVFVAMEVIHGAKGQKGLTAKMPWLVALSFGLLHGFGFAGALSEVGLPEQAIPLALLFFNVGVEVGQLIFVVFILIIEFAIRRSGITFPKWARLAPPYVIGSVAMFWVVERVLGFF